MTQAILSITSLIIGILIGVSVSHSKEPGENLPPQQHSPTNEPSTQHVYDEVIDTDYVELTHSNTTHLPEPPPQKPLASRSSNRLLLEKLAQQSDQITELTSYYQSLESQLTETTRELNALTFRVETHSESFRPMRQRQDNSVFPSGITPLLPPKQ